MRSRFPRITIFWLAALLTVFGPLVTLYPRGLKDPPPPATPEPVRAEAAVSQPTNTKPILVEAFLRLRSGGMGTMVEHLSPAEVTDLIPVKPLAEMEPQVIETYRTRLPAIYQKIKP